MKSLFEVDIFIKTQLTLPSGEGEITTGGEAAEGDCLVSAAATAVHA